MSFKLMVHELAGHEALTVQEFKNWLKQRVDADVEPNLDYMFGKESVVMIDFSGAGKIKTEATYDMPGQVLLNLTGRYDMMGGRRAEGVHVTIINHLDLPDGQGSSLPMHASRTLKKIKRNGKFEIVF